MSALVAVLAGGRGRRMGQRKAIASYGGAALIERPLAAGAAAGLEAVVVAKRTTALPALDVPVWHEPDEPFHPLVGIIAALERSGGPVIAVGCDMPFVTAELLARRAAGPEAAVLVGGRLAPFPARYDPTHLTALRFPLAREAPLRATLTALGPAVIEVADARLVASVNTPEDLASA